MSIPRSRAALLATLTLAGLLTAVLLARGAEVARSQTSNVIQVNQQWQCTSAVDLELVRVVMVSVNDAAVSLRNGCSGTIDRLEIVTYTADGVTIQNATSGVAQNLTIGGGYVYCPDLAENAHQDGIQALGGTNITFQNLRIACGTSDANFGDGPNSQITIGKGGQGSGRPTDIVCDGCWLGPHASHTVLMGDSEDSGVSNSSYCTDRTPSGGWFDDTGATTPVNSSNTGFATAVCDAFSPYP